MTQAPVYLEYFERLCRLDRRGAIEVVRGYLDDKPGDVEGLYIDVLMPAMIHAGQEWEADRISVAHEHYISEVTRDLIREHGRALWSDSSGSGPVAVACCAPGERHTLGLMMICDILRAGGVEVHMLGEGAPAESVVEFVTETGANLLALSCALDIHLADAAHLIDLAKQARPGLKVVVGGAAFAGRDDRAKAVGADKTASDARELRLQLPELVGGPAA